MTEENKERIIIPNEDGEEHYFEELVRFHIDELDASYIVLVPEEQADNDEAEIYPLRLEEETDDGEFKLFPIESDEEWDLVEETLNTLLNEEII